MAVSKVSLSIEEDVLAEARSGAGRREPSANVNEELLRQLQHDRLGELSAEMESESGPRDLAKAQVAGSRESSDLQNGGTFASDFRRDGGASWGCGGDRLVVAA